MKIAMWSGPRNLSTALMYAFGNRADTVASDEPFYSAYLARTGLMHPMREAILKAASQDPLEVAQYCAAENPQDKPIWYQKHMTHHILPNDPLDWLAHTQNIFLIRHPAWVINSYVHKRKNPTLLDLGFVQQADILAKVQQMGQRAIIIDSDDILRDPEKFLRLLCGTVGIKFDAAMLKWPKGPKPFDGVWAPHWYDSAHRSAGFGAPPTALPSVPPAYADIFAKALNIYNNMAQMKIGTANNGTTAPCT